MYFCASKASKLSTAVEEAIAAEDGPKAVSAVREALAQGARRVVRRHVVGSGLACLNLLALLVQR